MNFHSVFLSLRNLLTAVAFDFQCSCCIEYGDYHHADISENRNPHICYADCSEHEAHELDGERKDNVFLDYSQRFSLYLHLKVDL